MAKPSITNIQPPSHTTVWTPPKSVWDLNNVTDQDSLYGDQNNLTQFDTLTAQINLTGTGLTSVDLHTFDYVFLGVNGGMDETVTGKPDAKGIIETGNGKDNITGGNLDDLIFAGNGADTVHGGAGNDKIYGENGPDKLYGDANNDIIFGGNGPDTIVGGTDTGQFSVTHTDGVLHLKDGVHVFDGTLGDLPQDTNDTSQPTDKVLNTSPPSYVLDSGKVYEVFDVKLTDLAPTGVGDHSLSTQVTVAIYKGGVGSATLADLLDHFTTNLDDGYHTEFAVELKNDPDYANAKVYVFLGNLDPNSLADAIVLNDPAHSAQTNAAPLTAFDNVAEFTPGTDVFNFTAGDILTGGNPDPNGQTTLNPTVMGPGDGSADTFVFNAAFTNSLGAGGDGVDKITDFHVLEGDTLVINGLPAGYTATALVHDAPDTPANDPTVFIAFKDASNQYVQNAAIELVGVSDPASVASHILVNGSALIV